MDRELADAPGHRGPEADTLMYALRVVRERWWIVALALLACIAGAVALSLTREAVYETDAKVLFGASRVTDSAFGIQRDNG